MLYEVRIASLDGIASQTGLAIRKLVSMLLLESKDS